MNDGMKQIDIGWIPEDWETQKLGIVGEIRMCRRIFNHQTTPNGDIPFFKIGTFGKQPDAFISRNLYEEYRMKYSFPRKGEILISAAGTIGRTVIYDGEDAYFQDSNIVWIENDNQLVLNAYLYYAFQTIQFNSEGGTVKRLYNGILKESILIHPPLPE